MTATDWNPDAWDAETDVYRELDAQRRTCPVPLGATRDGAAYYAALTHADVVAVTGDPRTFSSAERRLDDGTRRIPLEIDPPEHAQVRRLLQPYFRPDRLEALRPVIERHAREMTGDLLAHGTTADYMDVAGPFPARVLCALMNVPDEDWSRIKDWSMRSVTTAPVSDAERGDAGARLRDYVRDLVAERRVRPLPVEEDMTSGLLAARISDEPLDDDTVVGALQLMLVAGHLTTTLSLGIIVRRLAEDPALQQRLRDEPTLVGDAIEEILRVEPAVVANSNPRTVTAPVELGGLQLQPGDRVLPVWGAANRDETRFEDADQIVLGRGRSANVTFGRGIHLCIGAPVARLEMTIAVGALLDATEHFGLGETVEERATWRQQGPTRLDLALVPRQ
ncbi:cytochrome P450 [Nocardioides sp. zg-579]|uniref:Cytochrome P450 n=1 Tax=Nocardioides marmotae TaxID=2663857 RepID=A0A6I3J0Y2_9ACTN|nr:cytochrome P450 [Nocardioides marmotae]MCR6030274.1 cytochrome P450 [Gordonia jinghuaiqii]MTB93906.1 cytochrome P450 [Nocardioides marmotae]QKE00227.1 cytochrome P450 [Nocardioides marmotae]